MDMFRLGLAALSKRCPAHELFVTMCRRSFGIERNGGGNFFLIPQSSGHAANSGIDASRHNDPRSPHLINASPVLPMQKFNVTAIVTKPGIVCAFKVYEKHCVRYRVMHEYIL